MAEHGTYAHIVRSTAGRTPADPCPVYCTRQDAKDWHASAETVGAAVQWQLGRLEAYAAERNQIVDPQIDVQSAAFFSALDATIVPNDRSLPDSFRRSIDQSITVLRAGAELLEHIESSMLRVGMTPPAIPGFPRGAPKSPIAILPTAAAIGVVGLLAIGVWMAVRPEKTGAVALEGGAE